MLIGLETGCTFQNPYCLSGFSLEKPRCHMYSKVEEGIHESWFPWFCLKEISANNRDYCAWKSQEISSFWDTQTSLSGTNKQYLIEYAKYRHHLHRDTGEWGMSPPISQECTPRNVRPFNSNWNLLPKTTKMLKAKCSCFYFPSSTTKWKYNNNDITRREIIWINRQKTQTDPQIITKLLGSWQGGDQDSDGHSDRAPEFLCGDGRILQKDNRLCNAPPVRPLW